MGFFGRLARRIWRGIGGGGKTPPPTPPPDEPETPTPPEWDDLGKSGPVADWYIAATWDGPGSKRRYTGPDDLMRLGPAGQVIAVYRDPDTHLVTYRTIHGPFRGDEDDIWEQIEVTTMRVSPP